MNCWLLWPHSLSTDELAAFVLHLLPTGSPPDDWKHHLVAHADHGSAP